jgi:hypothetical protein
VDLANNEDSFKTYPCEELAAEKYDETNSCGKACTREQPGQHWPGVAGFLWDSTSHLVAYGELAHASFS